MNQRVSLSCWLSAMSPVVIDEPELGPLARRGDRAGPVRVEVAHHQVEHLRPKGLLRPPGRDQLATTPSRKSTRAGDISSAICGSVNCPKNASDSRFFARLLVGSRRVLARRSVVLPRRAAEPDEAAPGRRADRLVSGGLPGRVGEGDGTPTSKRAPGPRGLRSGRTSPRAFPPAAVIAVQVLSPMNRRPRLELHGSTASPEEAAAVIAAIEQFLRDTAPPPAEEEVHGGQPVGPGGEAGGCRSRSRTDALVSSG